jgi:hypothetical protein
MLKQLNTITESSTAETAITIFEIKSPQEKAPKPLFGSKLKPQSPPPITNAPSKANDPTSGQMPTVKKPKPKFDE